MQIQDPQIAFVIWCSLGSASRVQGNKVDDILMLTVVCSIASYSTCASAEEHCGIPWHGVACGQDAPRQLQRLSYSSGRSRSKKLNGLGPFSAGFINRITRLTCKCNRCNRPSRKGRQVSRRHQFDCFLRSNIDSSITSSHSRAILVGMPPLPCDEYTV